MSCWLNEKSWINNIENCYDLLVGMGKDHVWYRIELIVLYNKVSIN